MDDLIKKHDAIESVGFYSCHSGDKLLFADNALKNIPSVDAVEVVRCEDCQCYDSKNYYCTYLYNSNGPDGFCNFGERKINDS